jgi:hypothetical protein
MNSRFCEGKRFRLFMLWRAEKSTHVTMTSRFFHALVRLQ